MKKSFLFIGRLLVVLVTTQTCLKAQTATHSTKTIDLITSQTCECLTKQKDEIKNKKQFETTLGICIMQAAADKIEPLKKELGVKDFDEAAGKKMGEKVGYKLAAVCPAFMELSVKIYGSDSKTINTDSVATPTINQFVGTVKKINTDGYVTLSVANAEGKELNFIWIEYFKGSDKYKIDLQQLVGEKVTIAWKEKEIFNGSLKDYISIKEITGIEKQ